MKPTKLINLNFYKHKVNIDKSKSKTNKLET